MATTVGSLLVALGLDSAEFKSGLTQAEKEFKRSARRIENIGKSMQNVGRKLSIAVTAPLVALGVAATREAAGARDAIAQVNAALTSMGNVSGKTAEDLKKTAKELRSLSTFDDDDILRDVTANLLTFGKVSGEAFDRGQRAAVDMATRLKTDLKSATILVGKALNDPIKGLTALGRSGIQFTEDQKKMIKGMVESGRVAEAQAVILGELERQFKGAGKAARDAVPGSDMIDKWRDFKEIVGEALLTAFERIEPALTRLLDGFNKLSPGVQTALVAVAGLAAAMGPLLYIGGGIVKMLAPFIAGVKLATATVNAAGVATTSWTVALASLRAGIITLTATLAPYAIVLGTIGAVIAALIIRHRNLTRASEAYRKAQDEATKAADKGSEAARRLAAAQGEARRAALAAARQERQNIIVKLKSAQASLQLARAELITARARADTINQTAAIGDTSGILFGSDQAAKASANLRAQAETVRTLSNALASLNQAINAPEISVPSVSDTGGGGGGGGSRAGRATPERDRTAEIERRFNDELIGYTQQTLGAMGRLAQNADERAELELRSVEWARRQTLAQIAADEDYNDTQKARLAQQVEEIADFERRGIELQRRIELEREAADLAQVAFDEQRELLALAGDIADTQADRKRIALDILALEQEYRRNMLELVVASETASDAEKKRAQAILDSLAAIEAGERASVGRANETEVERYLRNLNKTPAQMNEALDSIKINGLEALNDALVDAMVNFRSLRDVVQSVVKSILADLLRLQIQQMIIRPLAQALGLGVPGFARGTNFAPGGLAIVGEKGPELVNLPRGSQVIPNHELRNMEGAPSYQFNVSVSGAMNDRDARRTGNQIASAAQHRMALSRRSGIAG